MCCIYVHLDLDSTEMMHTKVYMYIHCTCIEIDPSTSCLKVKPLLINAHQSVVAANSQKCELS